MKGHPVKFTLEIELGNEAMQSASDIADELRNVARSLMECSDGYAPITETDNGRIRDENGSRVGSWQIAELEPEATVSTYTYGETLAKQAAAHLGIYGRLDHAPDYRVVRDLMLEGGGPTSFLRFTYFAGQRGQRGELDTCEIHTDADRGRSESASHPMSVASLDIESPEVRALAAKVQVQA